MKKLSLLWFGSCLFANSAFAVIIPSIDVEIECQPGRITVSEAKELSNDNRYKQRVISLFRLYGYSSSRKSGDPYLLECDLGPIEFPEIQVSEADISKAIGKVSWLRSDPETVEIPLPSTKISKRVGENINIPDGINEINLSFLIKSHLDYVTPEGSPYIDLKVQDYTKGMKINIITNVDASFAKCRVKPNP